jgi:hypothetical protein
MNVAPRRPVTIIRRGGSGGGPQRPTWRGRPDNEYSREKFKPLVPKDMFDALRIAAMEHITEQDALLTAFCSLESLRQDPAPLHKLAIVAPKGQDMNDFAAALIAKMGTAVDGFGVEYRPAAEGTRYGTLFIVAPSRDMFFGSLSPFPVFDNAVDVLDLDILTWRPKVVFADRDWYPRQLVPSLLQKSMEDSGSTKILAELETIVQTRIKLGLPLPHTQQDKIAAAAGTVRVAAKAKADSYDYEVSPASNWHGSSGGRAQIKAAEIQSRALQMASSNAWIAVQNYVEALIENAKLPPLFVAFPTMWDFVELDALHGHARALRAQFRASNPGGHMPALNAYITAAFMMHHENALWTLLLLPVIGMYKDVPHPLGQVGFA